MRSLLVALTLLTTSIPAAQAKCARPTLAPVVLTTSPIPAGAGLLVHTEMGYGSLEPGEASGEALQPTWRWKDSQGVTTTPTVTPLAPGLVVYRLPEAATALALQDGGTVRAQVTVAAASKSTLAAPVIGTISHVTTRQGRGNGVEVRVALTQPVPAGAVAAIVYDAKSKRALSYRTVTVGADTADVYGRGRCSASPDGTAEPTVKQRVFVRYVDQFGRLSPASKVKVIVAQPQAQAPTE